MSVLVAAALAGCTDGTQQDEAGGAPSEASGWVIDPGGDLNAFFECIEAQGASLVSAHRGGPYPGFPENAVETMAQILREIPAIMEIDVAASADGVLFLMHDDTLERTTTGAGDSHALSWNGIKSLRLEDNDGSLTAFAPSRFDDALGWARSRTILQIDFKPSASYEAVASEIKRQDAEDRVILIAYSLSSAVKLHRLLPKTMISLSINSQSELNRAVAAGVPADRILGFTGTQAPRPRLFSILDKRDVEVIFGTLGGRDSIDRDIAENGDEARYAEIAGDGADIIATDRPLEAFAALNKAGRAPGEGECGISKR